MNKKPIWKSKTFWFNMMVAVLAALEASAHLLQPLVVGSVYAYMLLFLAIGNTILRFLTSQGIGRDEH